MKNEKIYNSLNYRFDIIIITYIFLFSTRFGLCSRCAWSRGRSWTGGTRGFGGRQAGRNSDVTRAHPHTSMRPPSRPAYFTHLFLGQSVYMRFFIAGRVWNDFNVGFCLLKWVSDSHVLIIDCWYWNKVISINLCFVATT